MPIIRIDSPARSRWGADIPRLGRSSARRGISIALTLVVLMVIMTIGFAMSAMGIHSMNLANADLASREALYAAEAGINDAIASLQKDSEWTTGFTNKQLANTSATYTVTVTPNASASPITAPNGSVVPANTVYLFSVGRSRGTFERRVGVVVEVGSGMNFEFAIATGGNVTLKASSDIHGSVKSSGDLVFEATADVIPVNGNGRVLATNNIQVKTNLNMDGSQDVRAANDIDAGSGHKRINGTTAIAEYDASMASAEFIADGRVTNDPPPGRHVLPNPDTTKLLDPGKFTDHGTTTSISGTFDLGGGIHYFPNGIKFEPGSKIIGQGTIVVGNGNTAEFHAPIGTGSDYQKMNVIAIDSKNGTVGGNSIIFKSSARIQGLVYSHDDITSVASLDVNGSVVSYKPGGGDVLHTGASLDVKLTPLAVPVPGLEPWFGSGAGAGSVTIRSWER